MDEQEQKRLYEALAHGDELHRRWLKDALEAFFKGQPVPPPYERRE